MPASFESVNYSLRAAKNVERKMLAESFRRLVHYAPLEQYRYMGMGAIYFSDFTFFHKTLGISNMISMEHAEGELRKKRVKSNIPFGCIKLDLRKSSEVLREVSWDSPTILWLDYDWAIHLDHIVDVETFSLSAQSGSVLLVTLNVNPLPPEENENKEELSRTQVLESRVGKERVPLGDVEQTLAYPGLFGNLCRKIIDTAIDNAITDRNGKLPELDKLRYVPLYRFLYRDGGAWMMTVGGILSSKNDEPRLNACRFTDLPYCIDDKQLFKIDVPNLTYREARRLDALLPADEATYLEQAKPVPAKEAKQYRSIYRYFPNFAEAAY